MSTSTLDDRKGGCRQPGLNKLVTPYCFGEASTEQRRKFEEHLYTCAFCQHEVERLSAAVTILRNDETVCQTLQPTDIYFTAGISGKSDFWFCGHARHILLSAFLYSLTFVLILLIETAYEFDQLGRGALIAAPFVFLVNFAALLGAVEWMKAAGRKGSSRLVLASSLIIASALATVAVLSMLSVLPNHAVTRNHTTGWTAQTAYLKDLGYLLPITCLLVLRPFQFVAIVQQRLAQGRHEAFLPLLAGEHYGVGPRGVVMPSKKVLIFVAVAMAVFNFVGLMHLLDTLEPSKHSPTFVLLLFIRLGCFFLFMGEAIHWYGSTLNEMLRECLAVVNTRRYGR